MLRVLLPHLGIQGELVLGGVGGGAAGWISWCPPEGPHPIAAEEIRWLQCVTPRLSSPGLGNGRGHSYSGFLEGAVDGSAEQMGRAEAM